MDRLPSLDKKNDTSSDTLHNLMNYSMPNSTSSLELGEDMPPTPRRQIQYADVHTRLRQLEYDMEQLTLSNVRLLRTNRILKLDCDRLVDEQTQQLKQDLTHLRRMNVQLQRSNRLLQDDMRMKTEELRAVREDQIRQMKNVGPEYEYLVQMIHLLYRQIDGKTSCDTTCCYTNLPLSQSFSVLTLPPESQEQRPEAQHICRPVIHSAHHHRTTLLERDNEQLRQDVSALTLAQDDMQLQIKEKDSVAQVLLNELRLKDTMVSQLEKEFARMEQVLELQEKDRLAQKSYHDQDSIRIRHSPYSPVSDYSLTD